MGIEPTTYSLGSCRSTTELRPQRCPFPTFGCWHSDKNRNVCSGLSSPCRILKPDQIPASGYGDKRAGVRRQNFIYFKDLSRRAGRRPGC